MLSLWSLSEADIIPYSEGGTGNFHGEENAVASGSGRESGWLHVGPTIASRKPYGKDKDTNGYSDVAMVREILHVYVYSSYFTSNPNLHSA